eukprot:CAMPEP_0119018832 /NCGR_PEP_ID=MMETSP1176-20130426/20332_1 /TAXON_ID=265551 /ORGANISM="Synedropsis recta cf, Strain CCMP1620" /LENGTH=298 /DNA_ID=CAMNT_0006972915 /DNA_START=177 /DNA_END=1073 /DNA_ORIENTATION=+
MNVIVSDCEEEESKSENWDFAIPSDDDAMDSYLMADTTILTPHPGIGGILIVGGDSTEIHHDDGGDFSLPGTESLPTDVGSLNDTSQIQEKARGRNSWAGNRRMMLAVIVLLFALLTTTSYYTLRLWRDHQGLLQRNELLQTQVGELEHQVVNLSQDIEATKKKHAEAWSAKTSSDWEDEDFIAANKVLLADNCWFKAELEVGSCLNEATDSISEFSADATKVFQNFFGNSYGDNDATELFQANAWKAASDATNVVATAAVTVMDSMVSLGKVVDESVFYAIEQTRDAIEDATLTKHI